MRMHESGPWSDPMCGAKQSREVGEGARDRIERVALGAATRT